MSASESRFAWPIIWINGFPGTGKLTIAKLLATLIDQGDPLKGAREERPCSRIFTGKRSQPPLPFLLPISNLDSHLIIDFQSNNDLGRDVAREYEAAALRGRRPFLPIYLDTGTTKLLSPEVLAEMRSRCQIFRFDGVESITFDVTNMRPEEAAEALAREVRRIISDGVEH
ncbi:hypothetical protein K505DRAFT_347602 [Melanomma pulvis-pyrius CBS 109.77]|uniref:Uncharacterized protein n=1 Tax=Melanomma pulvis-pyrius CBS 109.77 TaxID=1314802 RepID=A0A6A6XLW0_9PLEO|nr:hypothetical protein K505DRAFT_347602 [Melanomma pulvis-pyrius CBS 109.77]